MVADWYGWIMGREDRRAELEAMGIKLGPWDPKLQIFSRCFLSSEAFARLARNRGRFLWKLTRVKQNPKSR